MHTTVSSASAFPLQVRLLCSPEIPSYLSLNVDHRGIDVVLILDLPQQSPFLDPYRAFDHPSQRLVVVIDGVSLSHLQGPKLCYDIRAKALSTCEEITDGWNLSELSTLLLREHLGPILIAKPADTTGRLCRFVVGFALPKCILPAISYYSRKIVWASALLRG